MIPGDQPEEGMMATDEKKVLRKGSFFRRRVSYRDYDADNDDDDDDDDDRTLGL